MSLHIQLDQERIAEFCRRHRIQQLSVFGSALREDFRADSDVDVLVTFEAVAAWGLFELVRMQEELRDILGREVDLVERESVERSENYIRRKHILQTEEPIYVAR